MGNEEPLRACSCKTYPMVENKEIFGKVVWRVRCLQCGMRTQIMPTPTMAMVFWNEVMKEEGRKRGVH